MSHARLVLPSDRSIQPSVSGYGNTNYSLKYQNEVLDIVTIGLEPIAILAFSCLVAFVRSAQLTGRFALSVGNSDYFSIFYSDGATLHETLSTLSFGSTLDDNCHWVGLKIESGKMPGICPDNENDELVLYWGHSDNDLNLTLYFNRKSVTALTAQDLLEKIAQVITTLAHNPNCQISEVDLLTQSARKIIPHPSNKISNDDIEFIPLIFNRVASTYADQPAVLYHDQVYTYSELRRASQILANRLIASGVAIGDIVTISGRSSFGVIASAIAILHVGGILAFIDDNLPEERRKQISELADAKHRIKVVSDAANDGVQPGDIVTLDWPQHEGLAEVQDELLPPAVLPSNASAYLFFTSGSTGMPKGVLGAHLGLAHFIDWQRREFPIGPGDRSAQVTALSFDVVLRDIFYPLTSGAAIGIPDKKIILDARKMLSWISNRQITVLHSVPSLMKAWLQAEQEHHSFHSLKFVFFAGEPLTDLLLTRFKTSAGDGTTIVNLYGPTETTLAKLANCIEEIEVGVQPIGRPLPGVDVYIMRERKTICGLGELGEIAIRTPYRSHGYFDNIELTNQFFISNPFQDDPSDLIYFTGDLGRYRSDGKVEIFGRIDAQIKIRGVRIEPNEVESQIMNYPGIKDAAVVVRQNSAGDKVLIALVVNDSPIGENQTLDLSRNLREFLKARLHEAMVPSRVVPFERLPYLPNGKLNRKALASLDIEVSNDSSHSEETISLDEQSAQIVRGFEELLATRIYDLNMSFVDLGGDSLSFITATLLIEDILGSVPHEWENLPIRRLVNAASENKSSKTTRFSSMIIIRAIAITNIVFNHLGVIHLPIDSTWLLFVISGVSFGDFNLKRIISKNSVTPVMQGYFRIFLPTFLFLFLKELLLHRLHWENLLMVSNLIAVNFDHGFGYWFIDVLLQIYLVLAVIFSVGSMRKAFAHDTYKSAMVLLYSCFVFSVLSELVWNTNNLFHRVPQYYLWTMFLGIASRSARSHIQKLFVAATGILFLSISGAGPIVSAIFLALVLIPEIPLPRQAGRLIGLIAGASLFIYISHFSFARIVEKTTQMHLPWLEVCVAIIGGIVLNRLWNDSKRIFRQSTLKLPAFFRLRKAGQTDSRLD